MFFPSRYAEWLSMEAKKFSTTLCCARRRDIYTKQVTAVCPYEYKISQWAIFMENVYSSARHDLFEKKKLTCSARDFMWGSLSSWGAAWLRSLCIREVNSRGVCSQYYFFDCSPNGNTENSLLQCKYKGSGLDADVYRVLIRHSNFNYLDTLIECNFNFADKFYVWFPNKLKIDNWILAFNIDSKIFEIFCWK